MLHGTGRVRRAGRRAFDRTIADFQNTQFKLADLAAATVAVRVFVDHRIELQVAGSLDAVDAAAKLMATELHCPVVDEFLQHHRDAGYMWEYPECRAYADARIVKIAGGAVEVMKQIIARDLFGRHGGVRRKAA